MRLCLQPTPLPPLLPAYVIYSQIGAWSFLYSTHLDKNVNGEESPISRQRTYISHIVQTWNIRSSGGVAGTSWLLAKLYLVSERWLTGFLWPLDQVWSPGVSPSPPLQCELDKSTILNSEKSPDFSYPQCLPSEGGIMLLLSRGCYKNRELRLTQCFSRVAT